MKKLVFLALLPLLLGACTPNGGSNQGTENGSQGQTTETGGHSKPSNHNTSTETDTEKDDENGGNTETGGGTGTGGGTQVDVDDSNLLSLDEWREYEFHEGHEPAYHEDWDFYYGTTFEPFRNCLWENPNEKVDYSGIEFFDKKQYMESPEFKRYPKVEIRFQFWFSSHQSTDYKAIANEPQFKIEEYNASDELINTDVIEITKSNVPKNNSPYEKKLYVTQSSMTHFNIRFNNFIANGDSGYTAILCKISLKGWPQV